MKLVNEDAEPLAFDEQLFYGSYKAGYYGESLLAIFMNMLDNDTNATALELECFILGYALGQKQGDVEIDVPDKPKDDTNYH